MNSLDDVITEIGELTWEFDSSDFRKYVFEYACVACEWGGINPQKAEGLVMRLMLDKAEDYHTKIKFILSVKPNARIHAIKFDYDTETVTREVRADWGGGVSVSEYDAWKNRNND